MIKTLDWGRISDKCEEWCEKHQCVTAPLHIVRQFVIEAQQALQPKPEGETVDVRVVEPAKEQA